MIPLNIVIPIVTCVALTLAGLTAGYRWGSNTVQQKWDHERTAQAHAYAKQQADRADAEREARRIEQSRVNRAQEAQHAAATRNQRLQADADRARTESERLRAQLAAALGRVSTVPSTASNPGPTCVEYAATVSQLLAECSGRYQDVAAKADGIASDLRLMIEAWPK